MMYGLSLLLGVLDAEQRRGEAAAVLDMGDASMTIPLTIKDESFDRFRLQILGEMVGAVPQGPPKPAIIHIGEDVARHLRGLADFQTGNAMGKSYRPPTIIIDDPPCLQERSDEAAAKLEAAMLEIPNFYAPVKGRIVSQAKGPNRAQRRAR